MIHLDLSGQEVEALIELLQYQHSELRMEIAGTDSVSFRKQLKERKAVLKGIRERLIAAHAQEMTEAA